MKNQITSYVSPLYQKIFLDLKKQIVSGQLKDGQKLPSEKTLCFQYDVSRITIRKALNLLSSEKLISTIQGKGSYVNQPKITSPLSQVQGFSDLILPDTKNKKQYILKREIVQEPKIAKQLALENYADLLYVKRIFSVMETPLTIDEAWLSAKQFPDLLTNINEKISLYEYLEKKYQQTPNSSYREINTILPSKEQKKLLKLTETVPLFEVNKTVYNQFEQPFEFSHYIVRGDKMTYTIGADSAKFRTK